jgi:hypothetical protein
LYLFAACALGCKLHVTVLMLAGSAVLLTAHSCLQTAAAATTVSQSMATATGAMTKLQQQMNPAKVQQTVQQFAKENAKMEMAQEMMGDTLDGALDDEDTEAETGELVNQVRGGRVRHSHACVCCVCT